METIFLISIICTAFAVVWVHELTDTEGLLWFVPKYYPNVEIIKHILKCEACLGGWLSLFITIPFVCFSPFSLMSLYLVPSCLVMSLFFGHLYKLHLSKTECYRAIIKATKKQPTKRMRQDG